MDQRGQPGSQDEKHPKSKRRRLGSNVSDQVENPTVTPSLATSDDELALDYNNTGRENVDDPQATPRPNPRPRKPRTPRKEPGQGHSHSRSPGHTPSRKKSSHGASSLSRGQSFSESSASASASTTSASTSGASYPRRHLNALRIADSDRVEVRSLTAETRGLPVRLKRFSHEMAEVLSGVGVVSRTPFLKPGTGRRAKLPSASVLPQWAYAVEDDTRDHLGPTPTLREVKTIFRDAVHAQDAMYSEHGWNCTVHSPLLKLAMAARCSLDDEESDDYSDEDGNEDDEDDDEDDNNGENESNKDTPLGLDFVPCTTARIISEYRPNRPAPSKMIDYVLTLALSHTDGGNEIDPLRRIKHLCLSSPLGSINHTDFAPLQFTPIAVSIETKRPGRSGGDEEAQLQMGVWQASQWKQLADLLYRVQLERIQHEQLRKTPEDSLAQQQATATGVAQEAISNLPFLPAIIVSGHDWSFAATTRDGSCTTLWADTQFGTTRTIRGIYSIVYGLQRLARWAREVFQPWYARYILLDI